MWPHLSLSEDSQPWRAGDGSQAQCWKVASGGPPDLPACLPPSTVAAEQMLCPGERGKEFVTQRWKNARRVKVEAMERV